MNNPSPIAVPVITIDGPGGSGKGTVGLLLAKRLGWHFLDSGALYRILALAALNEGIDLNNEAQLSELAYNLKIQFGAEIILDGKASTEAIRSPACTDAASQIAVFPRVREALLAKQRDFCAPPGLVADGRDMGTVVFPEATLKIFLEASLEERAKRRYLQLKDAGQDVNLETLKREIEARDARDKGRVVAPLKPAVDAVVIDTTGIGAKAVVTLIEEALRLRLCIF